MDAAQDWTEIAYGVFEANGYRIVAAKVAAGVCRYGAFATPLADVQFNRMLQVRYAIGEQVPQRRAPLGVFASPGEARAACATHAKADA